MHMADALISPMVGATMLASSAGVAAYSIHKIQDSLDEKKIPLMGVMGAFVFAAQMINFTIPGTGSSGHLGGGMLLAALLGPQAGFLTMASVLVIQALFFADGGLLALGCNIFNLGFFTCFVAYPLIYKPLLRRGFSKGRLFAAAMFSAVMGLQLGAFAVVLETLFSGKSELPFTTFALLMQPIHLGIGLVEGLVTFAVIHFVYQARPEIVEKTVLGQKLGGVGIRQVAAGLIAATVMVGGFLSWFASSSPDGLEWAMFRTAGTTELEAGSAVHETLGRLQEKTAILPDYGFKSGEAEVADENGESWPAVNSGTSASGLVGGGLTLLLAAAAGFFIKVWKDRQKINSSTV